MREPIDVEREQIRATVIEVLAAIAPEADTARLDPGVNIRDQIDFDSVDFLNLAVGLGEALKVEIPEYDYPRLSSIEGCVDYLSGRLEAA